MRIKIEFDLDVTDEAAARSVARQFLIDQITVNTMQGGTIETGRATPEESVENLVNTPKPLASTLAIAALGRGAAQIPSISMSNYQVSHIDS